MRRQFFFVSMLLLIMMQLYSSLIFSYDFSSRNTDGMLEIPYWLKPKTYILYKSLTPLQCEIVKNIFIITTNRSVIVHGIIIVGYVSFNITFINITGNYAYINFSIEISNLLHVKEYTDIYLVDNQYFPGGYPFIPGLLIKSFNSDREHYTSQYELHHILKLDLRNWLLYDMKGELLAPFIWYVEPSVLNSYKPLVFDLYKVNISRFFNGPVYFTFKDKKEVEEMIVYKITYLTQLSRFNDTLHLEVKNVIFNPYRLYVTYPFNPHTGKKEIEDIKYIPENKTLVRKTSFLIPRMYYDSASGILVLIELSSKLTKKTDKVIYRSPIFENGMLYKLFNISSIGLASYKYCLNGNGTDECYTYIVLDDTNIPLERPVFGKTNTSSQEIDFLYFKIFVILMLVIAVLILNIFGTQSWRVKNNED